MRKILFFVLLSCLVFGQNSKIDSIEIKDFKLRKEKLNKLLFKDLPKIPESENEKIIELYNEAEKITIPKLGNFIVYINNNRGMIYEKIGKYNEALQNFNYAYKTAIKFGDNIGSARALQTKAIFYGKQAKYDSTKKYLLKSIEITKNNLYNPIVDSVKNKTLLMNLYSNLAAVSLYTKNNNNLVLYSEKALDMALKLKNKNTEAICYGYLGQGYLEIRDYNRALIFYKKEHELAKESDNKITLAFSKIHIANTLKYQKNYRQAKLHILDAISIFEKQNHLDGIAKSKGSLFTLYRLSKDYKNVHLLEDDIIELHKKSKNNESLAHIYVELGEIYTEEKNFETAEKYFELAKMIYDKNKAFSTVLYYRKLALLKEAQGKIQEALTLKNQEMKLINEGSSPDFIKKIAEYDTKYRISEKNNKIKVQQLQLKIKEIQLLEEKTNRNIAISGIGFLLLLSGGGFWFFKNRQKQKELQNQNTLLGLQQNLNAMELQSLNKQLDPHEIKNLLASISPEIQEKAPESYRKMLKLFNITKASLNNHSLTESIENQIQQTEDFLSLEKSMLPEPLEYSIENKIQQKDLQIPRLMLKNLVENAVKHGIKGKENGGTIKIELFEKNHFIYITVDDTGRGRKQAISSDSGIGTSTYQKLFSTLNHKNKDNATFEITDKEQGTKVEVRIPKDYQYS